MTPSLQPGRPANDTSFKPGHGGQRRGSGRPRGSQNRVTSIFRDILLAAISEVGDSQTVGVDGAGGLKGFLKMCAVLERKTTLMLVGRILPLKISTEVKTTKETMTIHEAVADLRACGLDELLAFYLKRYPIGRDEEDPSWADGIDIILARDPLDRELSLAETGVRSSLRDIFRQIECLTPKQMIDVAADRARITEHSIADVLGDAPHQATVVSEWLAQYAASAKPTVPLVPPDNTDPSERPVNP